MLLTVEEYEKMVAFDEPKRTGEEPTVSISKYYSDSLLGGAEENCEELSQHSQ
jgi:hypothetical protein